MVFFIDDLFLRMLGFSLPPFDMFWMMELLYNYSHQTMAREKMEKINKRMKENRLLYELGEISRKKYLEVAAELNNKRRSLKQEESLNLQQRINLLEHQTA